MALIPQTLKPNRPAQFGWVLLLSPVLMLAGGCATLGSDKPKAELPPTGAPGEVLATWNPNVVWAPDPANQGRKTPALTGRIYLIDKQSEAPIVAEGDMVIALYEEHARPDDKTGQPLPLEMWNIKADCLKLSAQKDVVGWGYTLCLPWGTYRPDIGRIELRVRYQPAKDGLALYRDGEMLTLQNNGGNAQVTVQVHPVNPQTQLQANGGSAQAPAPGYNVNPQPSTVQVTGYGPQGGRFAQPNTVQAVAVTPLPTVEVNGGQCAGADAGPVTR